MRWFILFTVLLLIAAVPAYLENRRATIGKAARKGAAGKFAKLSQGVTHYRWLGPARGPVAVMIHGLTTPSIAWDGAAAGMNALGYRVLVYDLYGRGLSDAPKGAQNRAFFLRQLNDLLADQELQDDLTLVGYSMGGSIATAFASENPHRAKQVILLASAGIKVSENRFVRFCVETPILGDWVWRVIWPRQFRAALKAAPATPEDVRAAQLAQLDRKGFVTAALSSYRGMLGDTQEDDHRSIGRNDIPVVAIWGAQDDVIPVAAIGQLAQWNRAARQEEVKGAGHGLPFTHSAEVVTILRDVFREEK